LKNVSGWKNQQSTVATKDPSDLSNPVHTGVNFSNVKRSHFSYERLFSSYVLALNELSYEKFARLTLMKLTAGRCPSCSIGL